MEKRMRKIWNNKKLENTDQPKKTKKLFGKKNDTKKAKTEVKTDIQEYEDIGETKRAVWESKTEKEDSEVIEERETEKENKENKVKTKKRITIKKNKAAKAEKKADKEPGQNIKRAKTGMIKSIVKSKKDNSQGRHQKILKKQKDTTKQKRKIRIFNFSRRLLAMSFLPMIITCIIVTSISSHTLKSAMESELKNAMRIAAASIEETYTNLYKGDYTQSLNGAIKKGDVEISGNYDLVDAMGKKTSFDITMMFGNMRLLTTVKNESRARANGTSTDDKVYAKVEKGQRVFLSDFPVEDKICYVYYEPLKNSDGSVFGAVEVAEECDKVQKTINKQVRQLVLLSILIVVTVCAISLLSSRQMVQKYKKCNRK